MGKIYDLAGDTYNYLTVIEKSYSKNKRVMWKCLCECGNYKYVSSSDLLSSNVKSCGCHKYAHQKHGDNRALTGQTRLYRIWAAMKNRSKNKSHRYYKIYGEAGILVCNEWMEYIPFKEWALSNGYSEDLSIDRIDVHKGYYPENCRWANAITQANNTTRNHFIKIGEENKTIAEWSRESGIPAGVIWSRIHLGWDNESSVFKPVRRIRRNE